MKHPQERFLGEPFARVALISLTLLAEVCFERTEADHIQPLEDVGRMRDVPDNIDAMLARIVEELFREMSFVVIKRKLPPFTWECRTSRSLKLD